MSERACMMQKIGKFRKVLVKLCQLERLAKCNPCYKVGLQRLETKIDHWS